MVLQLFFDGEMLNSLYKIKQRACKAVATAANTLII